jgi:hypothetical protein
MVNKMAYFTDVESAKCVECRTKPFSDAFVWTVVKKHLREKTLSSDTNHLLKLVAFVLVIIIWADDQVTRLCSTFVHHLSVVRRNRQGRKARKLGDISHRTVWKVLHKQQYLRLYKFQLLQDLKPNDWHQTDFCTNMLNHIKEDNVFLDRIVFSDNATFHLPRQVYHQNRIILTYFNCTHNRTPRDFYYIFLLSIASNNTW